MLVRGTISDDELAARVTLLPALRPDVVGVFADPVIESTPVCGAAAVDLHPAASTSAARTVAV